MWSLEPDEVIFAEALKAQVDCEVYFPLRDLGIDLLAVRGQHHAGIQVKGSRYYTAKNGITIPEERWHTWHQLYAKKLGKENGVDFYAFVSYLPRLGEHKVARFEQRFLVIPASEIEGRVKSKRAGKNQVYSFYFRFDGDRVSEIRESRKNDIREVDYTEFLDNWEQIGKVLE